MDATSARRGETYGGRSRAQRASDRRERIVASAVHLFGTRDYDDVTVTDVCSRAKVSKRYFYEHFRDREDLVIKVQRERNEWLLREVAAAAPPSPAGLADVFRPALRTLVGLLRDNPETAHVIYINAPRMETRRRGVLHEDAHFVGLMLRPLMTPKDQVAYDRTLLALVAGVSEVIIDWLTHGMPGDPDQLADHLTTIAVALAGSL
ncbi:TetR/AcrR family transcriptional regulator [Paractinoplanes atraurantiacus]|uniref:TetR/AcrR family transcriptional regulator n=1 Tax=Paractinoplanes atraurantiacus TaxID=1036182 RepID=UPI000BE40717|nr:TetR/AcrR family transcriptional regulator [Actinoplanes atraurantiacus]